MTKAVVFDLDGTLADNAHRQHLVLKDNPEWDSFFLSLKDDLPNRPIVDLYNIIRNRVIMHVY